MVATNEYPVFDGGMTLTKTDLNALRTFLDVQDSVLGRLVGFGIAYGLDGAVSGGTVTIQPGLAIDQNGRGAVLAAQTAVKLTASTEKFSFVDPAPGGITPVLVVRDAAGKAPLCDEDCDSHAPLTTRTASIVLVAGRLKTGLGTFATDPLLALTPMSATSKGVVGDFAGIRKTIAARLDALGAKLATAARQRLDALTLDGIEAVRVYKAAFLNQVLFATIEYARCRTLREAARSGAGTTPGVALGWANGGTWDCRYRHSFVPSDGMAMALLGGGCGDPCSLLLDRLEAILTSYVEPSVPKPSEPGTAPPTPGGFHRCPPWSKKAWVADPDHCQLQLPERIPDYWWEEYTIPGRDLWIDPLRDPTKGLIAEVFDPFDRGTVSLIPAFGTEVAGTKAALEQFLGQWVTNPDVRVVTQDRLDQVSGFTPEAAAAIGDTIVLVVDKLGKVAGTGRIPVQHTLTDVGTIVQDAVTSAEAAVAAVGNFQGTIAGAVTAQITALAGTIPTLADLGALRTELNTLKGSMPGVSELTTLKNSLTGLMNDVAALKTWRPNVDQNIGGLLATTSILQKAAIEKGTLFGGTGVPTDAVSTPDLTGAEFAAYTETVKGLLVSSLPESQTLEGVAEIDEIVSNLSGSTSKLTAGQFLVAKESMDRLFGSAEGAGVDITTINAAKALYETGGRYQ